MAEMWEPNEEIDENEELVATDHRDEDLPEVDPEDEQLVETTADDPRVALEELGEDASSSPARRGQEDPAVLRAQQQQG